MSFHSPATIAHNLVQLPSHCMTFTYNWMKQTVMTLNSSVDIINEDLHVTNVKLLFQLQPFNIYPNPCHCSQFSSKSIDNHTKCYSSWRLFQDILIVQNELLAGNRNAPSLSAFLFTLYKQHRLSYQNTFYTNSIEYYIIMPCPQAAQYNIQEYLVHKQHSITYKNALSTSSIV